MVSPLTGALAAQVYKGMKGLFLDAVLTRDTPNVNSPDTGDYDPPAPTPVDYPCKAFDTEYDSRLRADGVVGLKDVEVMILANSLAVEPRPLDRITITGRGGPYSIVPAGGGKKAVTSDPARATWLCRCST